MTHTESAATQDHIDETEAARVLRSLAHNRTGSVPEELLVRHVMRVTDGGDWPLQRAAMESCLRRFDFADRDELRVAERPGDNGVFGIYRTRRRRAPRRPYATLLERLEPLAASCDCPDYLRSSLGLCKHLIVVLNDLASRPRRWQQALAQPCRNEPARRARLLWDPVRPLTGAGDWLERVRLEAGRADRRAAVATAQRFFRAGDSGALLLKDAFADRPQRRLALIEALLPLVSDGRSARAGEPVAHPAVAALLAAEQERLEPAAGRKAQRVRRHALRTLRRKLYPYQIEGVERAMERGRLLLADDMGLGKTAQAIAVCHALWKSGSMSTVARIIETPDAPDAQADDDATAEDEEAVERELEQTLDTSDQLEPAGRAEADGHLDPAGAGASLVEVKPPAQPPRERAPAAAKVASSRPEKPQRPGGAANVADLFSRLTIRTTHDGGVSIDAPPEAAADLAAVFEGLASILRASSQDPLPGRDNEPIPAARRDGS